MAKDKLTDYDSSTASNNTDVGGISVAEGMLPSAVNNSLRELTKQLGAFADGTDGIDVLSLADDDASHAIKLQAPSAVTANTTFTLPDGDGTADQVLKTDGSGQLGFADRHSNPSLIINGAMTIDQRNSGSALTVNTASEFYVVDRFMGIGVASDGVYTLQQVADAPDNFVNSIKATVTTPDASIPSTGRYLIRHKLEGNTISQLNLGSSAAQAFTLSFYVKSSLTGTFGGSILNGAQDRSYPFTYTISSAGVWERKTVTIAGDTTGTWPTDNTKAMQIGWSLGVGSDYLNTAGAWVGSQEWGATGETAVIATNGATWQITGVKLEVGSTATDFQHRSIGDELAKCQRYYVQQHVDIQTPAGGYMIVPIYFPTTMRATPTVSAVSAGSGNIVTVGVAGLHTQGAYFQVNSSANSNYILGRIDAYTAEL